jgi:modulator of FtsH protease
MVPYDASQWHDLFEAGAESAATLVGLLFIAVSLNLKQILDLPALPPLAARTLGVLLGMLVMSVLVLIPGQSRMALGAELTALGAVLVTAVMVSAARAHFPVTNWQWTIPAILLALASSLPVLVAGVTLLASAGGGLYWAVGALVLGFSISIYNAWILLIEILR